ncbi:MAG: amidohydrolase family protein [Bacteroidota bacterium]
MSTKHIKFLFTLVAGFCLMAGPVLGQMSKGQSGTFALTNATIETVSNGQVSGTLLIRDGKIAALGEDVSIPSDATTIDCEGMTIYPGLIDGGTRVGLAEVGSISLTQDFREVGDVNPQVQALTAVNPSSVVIPVTRVNGVTTVISAPAGGLFSGTAALINLHGYTPDQMYAGFKGIVMNFPSTGRRGRRDRRTPEEVKKAMEKRLKTLNDIWKKAEGYANLMDAAQAGKGEKPTYYPEMEALAAVVKGDMPLMIEVNAAADIEAAIGWVEGKEIKAIFTGVGEGWRVADKLAASKIPVIAGPVLTTPSRGYDRYDRPYANAGIMHKAGVKVAIRSNESENARNLPYNAGFAAAYGMGKEAALRAVTLTAAEIFGVSDQLGSLEVGKSATLFVADGDPFEPKTNITHLFISGWNVPVDSRHTRLYEEFLERSPGLKK